MKHMLYSCIRTPNIINVSTTRSNLQIQCLPYQNPDDVFEEIDKPTLKFR